MRESNSNLLNLAMLNYFTLLHHPGATPFTPLHHPSATPFTPLTTIVQNHLHYCTTLVQHHLHHCTTRVQHHLHHCASVVQHHLHYCTILVKKSLLWPGASQWRIYYHRMWGQLSTTCSNGLKQPNGELLVAVNHKQLRTMTPETVDLIDWLHPHPNGQYPLSAS